MTKELIGKKLANGRFEILDLIGEGQFAKVYEAKQLPLGRLVAAKILKDEHRGDKARITRFINEAQIMAGLVHPNIITIHDYLEEEFCLIMSRLYGSLDDEKNKTGSLPISKTIKYATDIARALDFISRRNIVHCDIKPSNAMLDENGTVVLTDFGIARRTGTKLVAAIEGTLYYMSPEQIQKEEIDSRSDLYSFGVMLYELVTGQVPFDGKDFNEIAQKHLQEAPIPPSEIVADINREFENIILKLVQKKKHERYRSASVLIEDLNIATKAYCDDQLQSASKAVARKNLPLAISYLTSGLQANPQSSQILKELEIVEKLNKLESLIAQIKGHIAAKEYETASEKIYEGLKLDAEHSFLKKKLNEVEIYIKISALGKQAEDFEKASQLADAIECLNKVQELKPDTEIQNKIALLTRQLEIDELTRMGETLFDEKNFEEAIKVFTRLGELQPQNKEIKKSIAAIEKQLSLNNLIEEAKAAKSAEDYETALEKFQQAIILASEMEYLKKEIDDLKKIIQIKSFIDNAESALKKQKIEVAISELEGALKIEHPYNKNAKDWLNQIYFEIHFKKANQLLAQDQKDEALKEYKIAEQFDQKNKEVKIAILKIEVELAENSDNFMMALDKYQHLKLISGDESYEEKIDDMRVKTTIYERILEANKLRKHGNLKAVLDVLRNKALILDPENVKVKALIKEIDKELGKLGGTAIGEPEAPPEIQKPKSRKIAVAFAGIFIILAVVVILIFVRNTETPKPLPVTKETEAYECALKIDGDNNESFDRKIATWQAVIDSFPSSAKLSDAKSRIEHWQAEKTFTNAKEVDANNSYALKFRIETWQDFKNSFSEDSQKVAFAEGRIKHWSDIINSSGHNGPPPDEIAFQNAQDIEKNPNLTSAEKEQAWQYFIDKFPSSNNRADAENRKNFWRSERVFEETLAIDENYKFTIDEKITAWQKFRKDYYMSDKVKLADDRINNIFIENFDNNNNEWQISSDNYIFDGQFRILNRGVSRLISYGSANIYDNFELETSVKFNSDDKEKLFNIAFRIDKDNLYLFGISGSGMFVFQKKINDEWIGIARRDLGTIPLKKGDFNLIKIIAKLNKFEFYLNRFLITKTDDNTIPSGRVGFYVEPDVMVQFDYLKIKPLD